MSSLRGLVTYSDDEEDSGKGTTTKLFKAHAGPATQSNGEVVSDGGAKVPEGRERAPDPSASLSSAHGQEELVPPTPERTERFPRPMDHASHPKTRCTVASTSRVTIDVTPNTPAASDTVRSAESEHGRANGKARERPEALSDEDARLRELMAPLPIPGVEDWGIPPEPDTPCDPSLQAKLEKFHALKQQGIHFNESLARNRSFRNPHIYAKLVQFVDIDETASNFPKEIWDPKGLPPEGYATHIAEVQKQQSEARQAAQAAGKRVNIPFTSASSAHPHQHDPYYTGTASSRQQHVRESLAKRSSGHGHGAEASRHRDSGGTAEKERRKGSRWDSRSKPPGHDVRTRSTSPSYRSPPRHRSERDRRR